MRRWSLASKLARACAVCMSGREDDVEFAFVATTVMMSILPVAVVGAGLWWVRRRIREMEEGGDATAASEMPAE